MEGLHVQAALLTDAAFASLRALPRMRELDVSEVAGTSVPGMLAFLRACGGRLRGLSLDACEVSIELLKCVRQHPPPPCATASERQTRVARRMCGAWVRRGLSGNFVPSLTHISLKRCPTLTSEMLKVRTARARASVRRACATCHAPQVFAARSSKYTALAHIDLARCNEIDDTAVLELLDSCKTLVDVRLAHCEKVRGARGVGKYTHTHTHTNTNTNTNIPASTDAGLGVAPVPT